MKNKLKLFDNPKNVTLFLRLFYLSLMALVAADFFIHKHEIIPLAEFPLFHPLYGFASCIVMFLTAKLLRFFVKRNKDYYK